jgi:lactoylglutathione lyase
MKAKFTYVGIRVNNLQESIDFYTKLLGMKLLAEPSSVKETKGKCATLQSKGSDLILELNYYSKDSRYSTKYMVGEGLDHLAFTVGNLDEALKEARKAGYPTIEDIKTKSSRWAYIQDPNGIWIELLHG